MTKRPLRIAVLKDRYPMDFMTARHSRHIIDKRRFFLFNAISRKLEGFTFLAPGPRADLVHANNRIPLGASRFVLSFEDTAPRRFGFAQDNMLTRHLNDQIASNKCRRLIAMSGFALRRFLHDQRDNPDLPVLRAKLGVRYPNIVIHDQPDALSGDDCSSLTLTFCGAHFGRKGGCVAVRIAQKAQAAGLPIRINIVSPMVMGESVWTDPPRDGFFDEYKALMTLPNVRHYTGLSNDQLRDLLGRSHFCILTTFADTFGFSSIEAMAAHTPVLATRVCALPEVVEDGVNGILIDMPLDPLGMWLRPAGAPRGSPAYEEYFRAETERIATEALARLTPLIGARDRVARMRRAARQTATTRFDSRTASAWWDALYDQVAAEDLTTAPRALDASDSVA